MERSPYEPSQTGLGEEKARKGSRVWSFIKKVLIGFGILFCLLFALGVVGYFQQANLEEKFDPAAESFIRAFLVEQDPWNFEKAKPHFSTFLQNPEFYELGPKTFGYYAKLGEVGVIHGFKALGCSRSLTADYGRLERCRYKVDVNYNHGKAQVLMTLVMEEEALKILHLKVHSPIFLNMGENQ